MRKNYLKWSWLIVLLMLGLIMVTVGCTDDDDDDDDSAAVSDPLALARAGWSAFEALDWDEAIVNFEASISAGATSTDAFSGAGWTYYMVTDDAYPNSNVTAKQKWEEGLVGKTGSLNDIHIGLGFLAFDEGDFDTAIEHIRDIALNISTYRFIHMDGVDINDLYITLAKSYYLMSDYEVDGADNDALDFIWKLNEHFLPDRDGQGVLTDLGIDEIAQEIERLDAYVRGF